MKLIHVEEEGGERLQRRQERGKNCEGRKRWIRKREPRSSRRYLFTVSAIKVSASRSSLSSSSAFDKGPVKVKEDCLPKQKSLMDKIQSLRKRGQRSRSRNFQ